MIVAAARRFLALLVGVGGGTLLASLALGALAGASLRRSLALGLYLVGAFLLLAAFFLGNSGVLRAESDPMQDRPLGFFGARRVRSKTSDERRETVSITAIMIALALSLLVLGALADDRHELV